VQFIGDFSIDPQVCDRLVELHRVCERRGLARQGEVYIEGPKGTVDRDMKDSLDVVLGGVPEPLQVEYGVPDYKNELQRCTHEYMERFPRLRNIAFGVRESPVIQYYRPGGGFKVEHFERMSPGTVTRILVWMTFLNDVTDAGGTRFVYQNATFDARKGRTLIWPPDFTHTHVGVVSPSQHKYIITGWFNFVP
jgi:prolyl 4-hydroxylase